MLSGKQEAEIDYSELSDIELREEVDAMRLALNASQTVDAEARLRQKLSAAEEELEKRNADRT